MDRRTKQLAVEWLAGQTSENTRAAYGRDLAAFAAWCDEEAMKPLAASTADIDRYRNDSLEAGVSPATVTRRLSGIASFFRYAASSGALGANPADDVERPAGESSRRETLDADELAQILDAAEAMGPKAWALVALLALDGMKLGELLAVNVPSVHIHAGEVDIAVDRHGKAGTIALSERSAAAVIDYVAKRKRGPLFLGESPVAPKPARLTRFGADFLIKRAAAAANIDKNVSAGMLRRSYVGAARRAGTSIEDIAHHIGHRETRETARMLDEQT